MNILFISWKNLASKPLTSALSLLLLTLGIGLVSVIIQVGENLDNQLTGNMKGIDMVVGAKGSPLQLILSSVFHVDVPTGNIPLKEAETVSNSRLVKNSIPLSYGDNYQGFRILGTTTDYLELYSSKLSAGNLFLNDMEVVLGADVSSELGLQIGDDFESTHGLSELGESHDDAFKVVGILEPTGLIIDQLILTNIGSVWDIHDVNEADSSKEITALLVKFKSPMGLVRLPRYINQNTSMQAALPVYEVNRLFSILGSGFDILRTIGMIIILVSGISVFISLFNTMKERRYELALLRSFGASKNQLVRLVLFEGLLLSIMGFVFGIILSRLTLILINNYLYNRRIIDLDFMLIQEELWLLALTLLIGLVSSLIPSLNAYKKDIHQSLTDG